MHLLWQLKCFTTQLSLGSSVAVSVCKCPLLQYLLIITTALPPNWWVPQLFLLLTLTRRGITSPRLTFSPFLNQLSVFVQFVSEAKNLWNKKKSRR